MLSREFAQPEANLYSSVALISTQHPSAYCHSLQSSTALVKRLKPVQTYKGHSSCVNALDWSPGGDLLVSGGEDCRIKIWSTERANEVTSFDSGHTSSIYAAKFMPNSANEQMITSAADRQIRHVDLQRHAIKPYACHSGKVKALVPLDANMFVSGSDDGTARHFDMRESSGCQDAYGLRTGDIIADQKQERTPHGRAKMGINSIAVDPVRPHLFITGSNDSLVRLYDRRMSGVRGQGGQSLHQWVACYIPAKLKSSNMASTIGSHRVPFVTSVKFSRGGDQLFASYSGDHIYSFDSVQHARDAEAFCKSQGWSRANSASGTRSSSRHAMLLSSLPATATRTHGDILTDNLPQRAQPDTGDSPQTDQATLPAAMPRPQSGASQHANSSGMDPEASAAGPASGGGLSQAAAAAVAHIRRRRVAAMASRAHTSAPQNQPLHSVPAHAAAGNALPAQTAIGAIRTQPDVDVSEVSTAGAITARGNQTNQAEQLIVGAQPAAAAQPACGQGEAGNSAPDAQTDLDRVQGAQRPPLPFHSIRRSARLHKPADTTVSGTASQMAVDQADCASAARASVQGNAVANGPTTRHSCKRKLAGLEGAAEQSTVNSHNAQPHDALSQPVPQQQAAANQHRPSSQDGHPSATAVVPSFSQQLANDGRVHQGSLHSVQPQAGMPALRGGQNGLLLSARQMPSISRHACRSGQLLSVAAGSQVRQQASQLQTDSHQAQQDAVHQQAAQQGPGSQVQQKRAKAASSRRLEQPTASTGTSRPEPMLASVPSAQLSQTGPAAMVPPAEFLRLQYSTEPPSSASNSREPSPDRGQQAGSGAAFPATAPNRQPRQLRSSRLAPSTADCSTAQPAHSTDTTQAVGCAPPPVPVANAQVAASDCQVSQADACTQEAFMTSLSAEPQPCDGCEREGLKCNTDEGREGTPASSNRMPTSAWARARASVEASTKDLPHQCSTSTIGSLHNTSPRGSYHCDRQPNIEPSVSQLMPQHAEASTAPEEEVLSPDVSTLAQLTASATSPRVASASDARCHSTDILHHLPEQLSFAQETASAGPHTSEAVTKRPVFSRRIERQTAGVGTATDFACHQRPGSLPTSGQTLEGHVACANAQGQARVGSADQTNRSALRRQQHLIDRSHDASTRSAELQIATPLSLPDGASAGQLHLGTVHQEVHPSDSSADAAANSSRNPHPITRPARQLQQQHSRRTVRSAAAVASDTHLMQESVQPRFAGTQDRGSGGPAWAAPGAPVRGQSSAHESAVQAADAGPSSQGQLQHQSSRNNSANMDSDVGAIMQGMSDDEVDGEIVEESNMYQQCYKGHCNLSSIKELCLVGSQDTFVVSGSDDGWIFIWDRHSGQLVNMLHADDRNVSTVAVHPFMPMLASSGSEPVVKLWSPQAEEPCSLDRAEAIMASNARELAEGDRQSTAGAPPMWLNMLGTAVSAELRAPGEATPARANNPVRCTIM